ncbi:MAG TPA: acetyl-CoA carboxylase biotin carboxyl carrier protein [Thermomicrobiales bacterium]|nr:acetyl-CoA carboxylase biotin carboxyl carrier protein [Thermomicrobiales bacterium]
MSSEQQSSGVSEQAQHDEAASDFGQLAALVHAFIGMMHAGGIARMDVEHGGLRLSLRAHEAAVATGGPVQVVARSDGAVQVTVDSAGTQPENSDQHVIRAPMIGTFYVASAPNEPAFVQPGDVVEEGQTIGIIEAMKIMNEIAADRAGTVIEVLAQNAQTVEYGSPLIRLAPATE